MVCDALLDLVKPWTEESSGRAECRAVVGLAVDAIRALGPHRVRLAEIDLGQALALLTWVGAGGGAYGRRRGTPIGRAAAWWTVSALLGMEDDWPPDPAALAQEAAELRWFAWDPGDGSVGGTSTSRSRIPPKVSPGRSAPWTGSSYTGVLTYGSLLSGRVMRR